MLPSEFKKIISKSKHSGDTENLSKFRKQIPDSKSLHPLKLDIRGGERFFPIAKRKLAQLKNEMYDLGNDMGSREYQIGDAKITVESMMGYDTIRIKEIGGFNIFLISGLYHKGYGYSVNIGKDEYGNNEYKLKPISKTPKLVTFSQELTPFMYSSRLTVRSNNDYSKHVIALPMYLRQPNQTLNYYYGNSGYYEQAFPSSVWNGSMFLHYLNGCAKGYSPNEKGKFILDDENFLHGIRINSRYYSFTHSRHPYSLQDNYINLHARKNNYVYGEGSNGAILSGIPAYLEYKTYNKDSKVWEIIHGENIQLEFGETLFAVLSPTVFIKATTRSLQIGMEKIIDLPLPKQTTVGLPSPPCEDGCLVAETPSDLADAYSGTMLDSGNYDVTNKSYGQAWYDYDSKNIDSIYIHLVRVAETIGKVSLHWEYWKGGSGFYYIIEQQSIITTINYKYYLIYKCFSTDIIHQELLPHSYGSFSVLGENVSYHGERIRDFSCQIYDECIIYTYSVLSAINVNASKLQNEYFIKRVIGIINLTNPKLPIGFRQEKDVLEIDTLLTFAGDNQVEVPIYMDLMAIGVSI